MSGDKGAELTRHTALRMIARAGNVLAVLTLVFTLVVGVVTVFDSVPIDGPLQLGQPVFFIAVILGTAALSIEFIRRTARYVIEGHSFFSLELPTYVKWAGMASAVLLIGSGLLYVLHDPRAAASYREDTIISPRGLLANVIQEIGALEVAAATCLERLCAEGKKVAAKETPQCRSTRLQYNSCRKLLSHTFCISLHDIESDCARTEPFACDPSAISSQNVCTYKLREYQELAKTTTDQLSALERD